MLSWVVAVVAEKQTPLVDEIPDGDYVPAAIHDSQFGTCQVLDKVQCAGVPKVASSPDDVGEVVGDEEGCIAVLFVVGVGSPVDDAVVCHPAPAVGSQSLHSRSLI